MNAEAKPADHLRTTDATHTPGPWRVADKGYGWDHFAAIVTPTGLVATCHIAALSRSYEQTAADARLIAAAPAMLEALKALVPADFDEHPRDFADDWHRARAAIALATGGRA